jgi:hypothetical protein
VQESSTKNKSKREREEMELQAKLSQDLTQTSLKDLKDQAQGSEEGWVEWKLKLGFHKSW